MLVKGDLGSILVTACTPNCNRRNFPRVFPAVSFFQSMELKEHGGGASCFFPPLGSLAAHPLQRGSVGLGPKNPCQTLGSVTSTETEQDTCIHCLLSISFSRKLLPTVPG